MDHEFADEIVLILIGDGERGKSEFLGSKLGLGRHSGLMTKHK
jgi:hypothetical protein